MKRIIVFMLAAVLVMASVSALAVDGSQMSVQMVDKSAYLQQVSTRRCTFQCKYVNNHPSKTVAGFDLVYMALDRNQNVSMEETTQYIEMKIGPRVSKTSPVIYITNQQELAYLIIAMQKIYFTDGSVEEIDFAADENYQPYYFRVIN